MNLRKVVSTVLIATIIFFAPSMIPARAFPPTGCGVIGLLSLDTAFAGAVEIFIPCPMPIHAGPPAWLWAAFACPASIVLSALVANFRDNRQLTTAEAWTCGLLYWIPKPAQPHHP
jgi:hypothetical protein